MKCQSPEKHTAESEKVTPVRLIDTHSNTHRHTHTFTAVMDGNNISIGACGRQSFHPYVQTASPPRAKQKEKGEGEHEWWGEIFQGSPEKKPSFKKPSHVRWVEPNDQYSSGNSVKACHCAGRRLWSELTSPSPVTRGKCHPPGRMHACFKMSLLTEAVL